MVELEWVKKLIAILAIAFAWVQITGKWRHDIKPIPIKKHKRLSVSLFRYGLDYITDSLMNLFYKANLFGDCLNNFIVITSGVPSSLGLHKSARVHSFTSAYCQTQQILQAALLLSG